MRAGRTNVVNRPDCTACCADDDEELDRGTVPCRYETEPCWGWISGSLQSVDSYLVDGLQPWSDCFLSDSSIHFQGQAFIDVPPPAA